MVGTTSSSSIACGFSIHAVLLATSLMSATCLFDSEEASGVAEMAGRA